MEKKQTILLVVAIVGILLAVFLLVRNYRATQPQFETVGPQDVEREIQRIMNDPQMPPQAKRAAIETLRARTGTGPGPQQR